MQLIDTHLSGPVWSCSDPVSEGICWISWFVTDYSIHMHPTSKQHGMGRILIMCKIIYFAYVSIFLILTHKEMTALEEELEKRIENLELQLEVERTKNRRKTERLEKRHVAGEDAMTEHLDEMKKSYGAEIAQYKVSLGELWNIY